MASLAKGMYEIEYQVKAQNCKMQKSSANPFFPIARPAIKVRAMKTKTKIVAMIRVLANIFLICATGPQRKHVDPMATRLPNV